MKYTKSELKQAFPLLTKKDIELIELFKQKIPNEYESYCNEWESIGGIEYMKEHPYSIGDFFYDLTVTYIQVMNRRKSKE